MKKTKAISQTQNEIPAPEGTAAENPADRTYFIVNPLGTIHGCDYAHAREKLGQAGWRQASESELAAYRAADGNQRFDRPLAAPFTSEPDAVPAWEGEP